MHPPKTDGWNLKIMVSKRSLLLQGSVFRFQQLVFMGCTCFPFGRYERKLMGRCFFCKVFLVGSHECGWPASGPCSKPCPVH